MNQEQLMKFTLRKMEMEHNLTLKSKRLKPNFFCYFCRTIVVMIKAKFIGEKGNGQQ